MIVTDLAFYGQVSIIREEKIQNINEEFLIQYLLYTTFNNMTF